MGQATTQAQAASSEVSAVCVAGGECGHPHI